MVELVIVIAIIVILLALLLSGVQKVMEMTNQFKCANNLRQLSSGFITHQTQYGNFPDGGESGNPLSYPRLLDANGVPYATPNQNLGWGYQVLPFIELTTVWSLPQANNDLAVRGKVIPLFFCPRRRSPRTNYDSRWGNIATTDYAGNGGVEQTPVVGAFLGNGLNGVVVRRPNPADSTRSLPVNQGNISDGASNTLMLGEKYLDLKNMAAAQANTNAQSAGRGRPGLHLRLGSGCHTLGEQCARPGPVPRLPGQQQFPVRLCVWLFAPIQLQCHLRRRFTPSHSLHDRPGFVAAHMPTQRRVRRESQRHVIDEWVKTRWRCGGKFPTCPEVCH